MIIRFNFNCSWNSAKNKRISDLLTERILLLTGSEILEKIESVNFCEKKLIKEKLSENSCLLSDDRLAILQTTEVSNKKSYELLLEKDILLSMLMPGAGQSYFDNLILEFRKYISKN